MMEGALCPRDRAHMLRAAVRRGGTITTAWVTLGDCCVKNAILIVCSVSRERGLWTSDLFEQGTR
jgi:hypothetical protein